MPRILSVQSSVAFGHVGNSAATFPLMRMGCDVLPVYTVHFAASTVYGPPRGPMLTPDQVGDVVAGLGELGALSALDAVLSGFQGAPAMGARILQTVELVKQRSPEAIYCCDPVMGDVGRGFYALPGIPEFMRDHVIPQANIAIPNQFELDFLTGRETSTTANIVDAARALASKGPQIVVVTSAEASELSGDEMHLIAVEPDGAWRVTTPKLDRAFTGSGDVTAAVFLAERLRGASVADALARTASIVYGLLEKTTEAASRELVLVSAQDEFVAPTHRFTAERLD